MLENNEAIKVLADEIVKTSKQIVQHTNYDITVQGRISAIVDGDINKYIIVINGEEYEAISNIPLQINDICYATIAQNNYSNIIILAVINRVINLEKG